MIPLPSIRDQAWIHLGYIILNRRLLTTFPADRSLALKNISNSRDWLKRLQAGMRKLP